MIRRRPRIDLDTATDHEVYLEMKRVHEALPDEHRKWTSRYARRFMHKRKQRLKLMLAGYKAILCEQLLDARDRAAQCVPS